MIIFFWNSAEIVDQPVLPIDNKMQKQLSPIAGTEFSYDFGWIPKK